MNLCPACGGVVCKAACRHRNFTYLVDHNEEVLYNIVENKKREVGPLKKKDKMIQAQTASAGKGSVTEANESNIKTAAKESRKAQKAALRAERKALNYRKRHHGKTSKMKRKVKAVSALYIAPSFLGVLAFFFLPFLVIAYYSFCDSPISLNFVGLDNFVRLIKNFSFKTAVANTLGFSLVAVPLAVVLSLLLAIVLDLKIPFKSQFRTFFLSPLMVPVASIVLIWRVMFDFNGAVNDVLVSLGGAKIDWLKSSYSQIVVVILFLWKNLGYNMILFMAALSSIPKDILEVATLESASPLQIFFYIKTRYLSSTFLFVTIMSLISSFKVFREVYLLTGDHPYQSIYMLQHMMNNHFASLDYQKLSAAAILMSLVMIVIIGTLFLVEDRFGKDVEG